MWTALYLCTTLLGLSVAPAESVSAADFDAQIAKLTPRATRDERLGVAKWLRANVFSKHAPRAIHALEELARKDPDPGVRQNAVGALVLIAHRHDVPCPLGLVVALRDPVDEVRWEAAVLDGPYKRRLAPGALDALLAAAVDERVSVRSTALLLLAHAAGKDAKARAVIAKAKKDRVFEVRNSAHSAWFIATNDLPTFLRYMIRVREEPGAVLDALAEGSEKAKNQNALRNLLMLGGAIRIIEWAEDRPDELAKALLALLGERSPALRRGAANVMGAAAWKVDRPRRNPQDPFETGQPMIEQLLPYIDPQAPPAKEKPAAKPQRSKVYASLLSRKADAKLRDLAANDPDATVRAAAKAALKRWEMPRRN